MQASTLLTFPRAAHVLATHHLDPRSQAGSVRFDPVLVAVGDGADLADALLTVTTIVEGAGRARILHFRTWRTAAFSDLTAAHPLSTGDPIFTESREHALEVTRMLVEELKRRGVRADGIMLESPPGGLGALIAAAAREWGAGAIILADRRAATPAVAVRSVEAQLRRRASCPVLVCG